MGVRSDFHNGTTWGRRGHRPVASSTGARFRVNMLSAVSAQGQLRFMLAQGRVTAAVFLEFLRRLMVNASVPIFLIADGHPIYRAKSVKGFVEAQNGRLELHELPSCSPELNPDELVWNNLKTHALGRKAIESRQDFHANGPISPTSNTKAPGVDQECLQDAYHAICCVVVATIVGLLILSRSFFR